MSNWRNIFLEDFAGPISALSLVSDPDGFLHDRQIAKTLADRSIDVIDYADPVAFRYIYESKYREKLEKEQARLIVRVEGPLDPLPYDLFQMGRKLEYHFTDLFPKLATDVIRELDPEIIDLVYEQYPNYNGTPSVANTCDFILQRVYKIPYYLINTKTDFIYTMFDLHYSNTIFPPSIQQFLISELEKNPRLKQISVDKLVTSTSYFRQYIQQQWTSFLKNKIGQRDKISETSSASLYQGDVHPFDDPKIRGLLASLFVEGKIIKVRGLPAEKLPAWTHVGLELPSLENNENRFRLLLERIEEELISGLDYQKTKNIAALIGEAKFIWFSLQNSIEKERWEDLNLRIDDQFQVWLQKEYDTLFSLPHVPKPVMVHHIPHNLSWRHSNKTALIILDGMNFTQWVQIRTYLDKVGDYVWEEDAVFAWVPTITSVSRQAIFSGELPFAFSNNIRTTSQEEQLWKLFWENQGIHRNRVYYKRGLGEGDYGSSKNVSSSILISGLVIDIIDKFIHRALQGQKGISVELQLWLENNYLHELIQDLLSKGFSVYITSDHGNTECKGIGRPQEGLNAHTKGQRVRIYENHNIRDRFLEDHQGIAWDGHGLPSEMSLLLAGHSDAFVNQGQYVVSHGGISLEEVIVPFVEVKGKRQVQHTL